MQFAAATAASLDTLQKQGLIDSRERGALAALATGAAFASALDAAETVHLHIKVDDTHELPVNQFFAAGAQLDHQKDGFVKFRFPGGLNAIFSHIKVAQDELAETPETRRPRPFLDHVGIDLRDETDAVRAAFDALPDAGRALGWAHAGQGGAGKPVLCCHVEVAEKHWLYPHADGEHAGIPLEFAYGALKVTPGRAGCDLRPADPRLGLAVDCGATACGETGDSDADVAAAATKGAGYYNPADLARFAQITRVNPQIGNAFFAYYGMVMGDGVLSKREKALAALAVAHAQKCPYCIDAYTSTLHGLGVTEAEMSEIVHVAAAMVAGISLVHSVQMMNKLDALRGCDPSTGCC